MAGRRTISFDGVSLQDGVLYKTQEIHQESLDNREVNIQRLGKGDGGKFVSETFAPKIITLKGTVYGTDADNLEQNIDSLKELLNRQEKDLDIQYDSGTRRFICSVRRWTTDRKHFNLTYVNWEAEFICSNPPFGQETDTSTSQHELVVTGTGTIEGFPVLTGTRRPMPIIDMTVNAEVGLSKITFRNVVTNGAIVVTEDFAAADRLIINTADFTVTYNGAAHDYSGFFPEFVVGGNHFAVELRADSANVTLKLIYYPFYL